jgi:hypothetical protein
VPDLTVASTPIAGRGPSVTRGASFPGIQASSAPVQQIGPPIVPVGAAVRSIHYPWFVRRLGYVHILAAIGFTPLFLVQVVHVAGTVCDVYRLDNSCQSYAADQNAQIASAIIGAPFWAVAAIILISLFGYALTNLVRQRRWRWFGVVLALVLVVVLYPVLGLWAFGHFGPTTPAQPKPAGKRTKG